MHQAKGNRTRRLPLHPMLSACDSAIEMRSAALENCRRLPVIEERQPLLVEVQITMAGQPVEPGMTPGLVRHLGR